MCGIAGIHTSRSLEEARGAVSRMIQSCRHRGPDGTGEACIPLSGGARHLVLGHARLSILDLSERAAQPMHDPVTNSWLVYNGEIYNFREIRSELQSIGYDFQSHGDTEVLLKALVEWGEECLRRLKGMYAFAFWDGQKQRLILGRDPFGIKPLLLAHAGNSIVFASELRSLRDSGIVPLTLDPQTVGSYLTYGAVIEPSTIAAEVLAVPPGRVVVVDAKGHAAPPRRMRSLGDLPRPKRDGASRIGFKAAVQAIRDELARSVESHLVSDVPLGVFLSGGIDSSIIATLTDKSAGRQEVNFLTIGFPEQDYSEIKYASQVTSQLAGTHRVIHLTSDDLLKMLPAALAAMDQPTVDGINTYVISRVAAGLGIKVLLSGLGGDEVFGGYTTFRKVPILSAHSSWLSWVAKLGPMLPQDSMAQWHKVARSQRVCLLRDAYLLHRSVRWRDATSHLCMRAVPPDDFAVLSETLEEMTSAYEADDFYQIGFLEMIFYMRNQLLRDADIFSSANSVELRVPYLDLDLIQKAWSLPKRWHVSLSGRGKRITRRILSEMHPGLSLGRRKMGFVFPWKHWLRQGPLYEMVADVLHSRQMYERLGLDYREGGQAIKSFEENDPLVSWAQLWSLFVLLDWQERNRLAT